MISEFKLSNREIKIIVLMNNTQLQHFLYQKGRQFAYQKIQRIKKEHGIIQKIKMLEIFLITEKKSKKNAQYFNNIFGGEKKHYEYFFSGFLCELTATSYKYFYEREN